MKLPRNIPKKTMGSHLNHYADSKKPAMNANNSYVQMTV